MISYDAYAVHGFGDDIIPILPPNAPLSPTSDIDPSQCGKIPGCYTKQGWVGFAGWTNHEITAADRAKWQKWPAHNKGLRAANWPGVDIDIPLESLVTPLIAFTQSVFGVGPVRGREDSARVLLPYRRDPASEAWSKFRVVISHPDIPVGPKDNPPAIEFLMRGQQYLVEGVHPSGKPYVWRDGEDLLKYSLMQDLPAIGYAQFDAWVAQLPNFLKGQGARVDYERHGSTSQDAGKPIGDRSLMAADFAKLADALKAIPNKNLDYDSWIALMHAVKAACGGDNGFYFDYVLDWCLQYPDNDYDSIERVWGSIEHSRIGADYVYAKAKEHGWTGNTAAEDFDPIPEDEEADRATRESLPIRINPGREHDAAREMERRLLLKGVKLFQYNGAVVEVCEEKQRGVRGEETAIWVVQPVTPSSFLDMCSQHLEIEKRKPRGGWATTGCPEPVAKQYLSRSSARNLPTLTGLVNVPTLRPDGTILNKPGYDAASGLLYIPDETKIPPIPDFPTLEEAKRALQIIKEDLLSGFPFKSGADLSVALSFILSSCARKCFAHAPMHLISAPKAGSGKGKLVNIASMIATGRIAAATDFSADAEELRKTIEAHLMKGVSTINLDNVDTVIGGRRLCSIITEDAIEARVLGQSKTVQIPCSVLLSANGNNLRVKGDMRRRSLLSYIDPEHPHPEERKFDFEPVERAKERRGRYVAAVLIVLVAYIKAGRPGATLLSPWGSFGDWSELIRGALVWCGERDPIETIQMVKAEDLEGDAFNAVLTAWSEAIGDNPVTLQELIDAVSNGTDFTPIDVTGPSATDRLHEALLLVAGGTNRQIDKDKLGYWLRSNKNAVSDDGLRIVAASHLHGQRRWRVEKVARAADKHD